MAIWTLDTMHTSVTFKVRHLVISSVTGHFKTFDATVESEKDDFTDARIRFSADINSIDTGVEQRDNHLKSPDFFDAANHPKLSFVSTGIEKKSGGDYKVKGDLTIRGVSKPVVLDGEFGGIQNDMYGRTVAGFELTGKIDRQEFGLHWSAVTEAGSIVAGNDVKINIAAELIKQA
jgi:polyisoprenoid-binding protein YceI